MKLSFTRLSWVMALVVLAWGPNPARAAIQSFSANITPTLTANATVTTGTGTATVVLSETGTFTTQGQALSDFRFTLSNATTSTTLTGTASGQQINISSSGAVTTTSGSPTRFITNGSISGNGTIVLLEAIGGGQPSQMIVPNATSFTLASGNGVDNFNPYTRSDATFTLTLAGITSNTTVTATSFSFGTGPDVTIPGVPTNPIPEPSTGFLALSALVVGGIGGLIRKRLRRTTAPA
jgi:hypothetical protein